MDLAKNRKSISLSGLPTQFLSTHCFTDTKVQRLFGHRKIGVKTAKKKTVFACFVQFTISFVLEEGWKLLYGGSFCSCSSDSFINSLLLCKLLVSDTDDKHPKLQCHTMEEFISSIKVLHKTQNAMLYWQNHSAFLLAKIVYDFLRYNKVGMSKPKAQQPGQIEAVLCAGNSRDLLTVVELTKTTGSSSRRRGLWFYLLSLKFLVLAHALLLPIHGQTLNPKTLNWLVLKRSSSFEEHRSTSRDANSYFRNCLQQTISNGF